MPKVLVTGGAGFIGSHLVADLLRASYQVTVVDDLSRGHRASVPPAAKFHKLDVRSPKLRQLVAQLAPDYVCHLAAQVSVPRSQGDAAADAEVNIVGSLNVLEAARRLERTKVLFASSAAVYGEADRVPTPETAELKLGSPYALAKATVEQYLEYYARAWNLASVVVRPANVFGPRQDASGEGGVVAVFCRQLLRGEELTIHGQGAQTRDFVYAADVAAGMVAALREGSGVYNLGTGTEVSVRELAIALGEVAGQVPKVTYGPLRPGDIARSALDARRVHSEFGWQPQVPFVDGLRQTLQWCKEQRL